MTGGSGGIAHLNVHCRVRRARYAQKHRVEADGEERIVHRGAEEGSFIHGGFRSGSLRKGLDIRAVACRRGGKKGVRYVTPILKDFQAPGTVTTSLMY
jgi:hypothetical protein